MYKKKGHDFYNYYMRSIAIKKRSQSQYNMIMDRNILLDHYLKEDSLDRKNKRIVDMMNALRGWLKPILTFIIIFLLGRGYLHFSNVSILDLVSLLINHH